MKFNPTDDTIEMTFQERDEIFKKLEVLGLVAIEVPDVQKILTAKGIVKDLAMTLGKITSESFKIKD